MTPSERQLLLSSWIKRSSDNEQDRQDRAERMIRDAIKAWPAFDPIRSSISVYTKGSYPNNTNVPGDSDVDVVVEFDGCQYYGWKTGVTPPPAGTITPYSGSWTPPVWRAEITKALRSCFGGTVDTSGKIAILVPAVIGSRPSADVVPSFEYVRYNTPDRRTFDVGSCVFDTSGTKIVNWPQQQLDNGRTKNTATGGRYKNYVRALKNAENTLVRLGEYKELPSYFMECLVYNVPNDTLQGGDLDAGFESTLWWLYRALKDESTEKLVEPNWMKWLFRTDAKWTRQDGFGLVVSTLDYLGYLQ